METKKLHWELLSAIFMRWPLWDDHWGLPKCLHGLELARDYANPSSADTEFPLARHKAWRRFLKYNFKVKLKTGMCRMSISSQTLWVLQCGYICFEVTDLSNSHPLFLSRLSQLSMTPSFPPNGVNGEDWFMGFSWAGGIRFEPLGRLGAQWRWSESCSCLFRSFRAWHSQGSFCFKCFHRISCYSGIKKVSARQSIAPWPFGWFRWVLETHLLSLRELFFFLWQWHTIKVWAFATTFPIESDASSKLMIKLTALTLRLLCHGLLWHCHCKPCWSGPISHTQAHHALLVKKQKRRRRRRRRSGSRSRSKSGST